MIAHLSLNFASLWTDDFYNFLKTVCNFFWDGGVLVPTYWYCVHYRMNLHALFY